MASSSPSSRPSPAGGLRPALTPAAGDAPTQRAGADSRSRTTNLSVSTVSGDCRFCSGKMCPSQATFSLHCRAFACAHEQALRSYDARRLHRCGGRAEIERDVIGRALLADLDRRQRRLAGVSGKKIGDHACAGVVGGSVGGERRRRQRGRAEQPKRAQARPFATEPDSPEVGDARAALSPSRAAKRKCSARPGLTQPATPVRGRAEAARWRRRLSPPPAPFRRRAPRSGAPARARRQTPPKAPPA